MKKKEVDDINFIINECENGDNFNNTTTHNRKLIDLKIHIHLELVFINFKQYFFFTFDKIIMKSSIIYCKEIDYRKRIWKFNIYDIFYK